MAKTINFILIGSFTKTLSHNIFTHLSKVTFTMYMISPIVVTAISGLKEVASHFDEMSTVSNTRMSFMYYVTLFLYCF